MKEENGHSGSKYSLPNAGAELSPPGVRRVSLVDKTVTVLKEWMRSGLLKQLLPGEKQLKARLGTSRGTLRRALRALAREGWISRAEKGCHRQVLYRRQAGDDEPPDDRPATFLSPHPVEHQWTLQELEETRAGLAAQGRKLRYVAPNIFHLKHPERHLDQLVQAQPSVVWILNATSEPIQRWFAKRHLPVLLHEPPFPGVALPFITAAWEGAAYDAGVRLMAQGHRVVGLFEFWERRSEVLAQERGLERALKAAPSRDPGRLVTFRDEGTPASVAQALDKAFSQESRPTALVLTRAAQLLTCYSWLAWRGIRLPADVSLISLAHDSWFNDLNPPVTYYQPNAKKMSHGIAERVLEIALAGSLKRKSLQIRLEYRPGSTVGPASRNLSGNAPGTGAGAGALDGGSAG